MLTYNIQYKTAIFFLNSKIKGLPQNETAPYLLICLN